MRFHDVISADGTRLNGWTNDVDGPPVLLCNGLGTPAYTWPGLLRADCGLRVVSWHHRGLGGSDRPSDPRRVQVEHFVEDALATMDAAGIEKCVVAGWSIGVSTLFELALRHPDRVTGLFPVAGVPADTFGSLFGAAPLPKVVRRTIGRNTARLLAAITGPLNSLSKDFQGTERTSHVLTHSGFMFPTEDFHALHRGVTQFLDMPIDWYMHVAVTVSEHLELPLGEIDVPTCWLAGAYDVIARPADQRAAAARLKDAEFHSLTGSHFLPMEKPSEVNRRLREFVAKVGGGQ